MTACEPPKIYVKPQKHYTHRSSYTINIQSSLAKFLLRVLVFILIALHFYLKHRRKLELSIKRTVFAFSLDGSATIDGIRIFVSKVLEG